MDNLEKYIKENRLLIDTENLSENFKNRLQEIIHIQKRKQTLKRIYWLAAASLILFSFLWLKNKDKYSPTLYYNTQEISTKKLSQEEHYYVRLINQKISGIENENIKKENIIYFNSFILQLKNLDKQYELCQKQIEKQGYTQELIQQTIYIYQLKLNVLQMMQIEINKINNRTKTKSNEKEKIRIY